MGLPIGRGGAQFRTEGLFDHAQLFLNAGVDLPVIGLNIAAAAGDAGVFLEIDVVQIVHHRGELFAGTADVVQIFGIQPDGDLAGILNLAGKKDKPLEQSDPSVQQVKVVAGAGFEPATFRL